MTFRHIDLLWLLLALPALAYLLVRAFRHRRETDARVGGEALLQRLVRGRAPRMSAARGVLAIAGLALLVLALAGPQYGSHTRMLSKRGIDVVVALDFSKSMLARDVKPSRIDRARAELGRLLDELGGDRVGLVAFAGETLEFPMTTDYAALRLFLRDLGPYDMPVGGTAIGRALVAAKRLLLRATPDTPAQTPDVPERSRVVLLVTDGEDHEGDPLKAAEELAQEGIVLHVVGIGSATGEPVPTYAQDGTWTGYLRDDDGDPILSALTPAAEQSLADLAERTGGQFFRARQGSAGIDEIRTLMRGMKQAEQEAREVRIAEDRYAPVLLLAFILLVVEALLPAGSRVALRGRAP